MGIFTFVAFPSKKYAKIATLLIKAYHVVSELVVQEVCRDMSRQQIEKYPLVAVLQGIHVSLLLVRLQAD